MFHVVLLEPEIPSNTGNIARTCVGTGATLHLIKPLGFEISDKRVKRAGLDYWQDLNLKVHDNFSAWLSQVPNPEQIYFLSTKVKKPYSRHVFRHQDWFVFGKETKGLPEELLQQSNDQCLTIPMDGPIRSLNLSNSVAVVLFEGMRQIQMAQPDFGHNPPL